MPVSFTEEDKLRIASCEGFTHFKANGDYKIENLFSEYVQPDNIPEGLVLPVIKEIDPAEINLLVEETETGPTMEEFWPQGRNNCCNTLKRGLFFFPHMYVPRYIFLLNPYAALQSAVVWIYSKVFGEDNVDTLKARISVSPFSWLKTFETFWDITLSFWTEGYPDKVHSFLGKTLMKL